MFRVLYVGHASAFCLGREWFDRGLGRFSAKFGRFWHIYLATLLATAIGSMDSRLSFLHSIRWVMDLGGIGDACLSTHFGIYG